VFVYDDSVLAQNRTKNRHVVERLAGNGFYIDEQRRTEILSALPWPTEKARSYATYAFKAFGHPRWDHGGIRSFAHFVAGACAEPSDRVLFLDDDIRLTSASFLGKHYQVDMDAVRSSLLAEVPAGTLLGAHYVGRTDMSLAEHLEQAKLSGNLSEGDIRAHDGKPEEQDFPIFDISGAFLMLRAETVRAVPPAHIFDEDWIFIAWAEHQGVQLRVADFKPIHDGGDFLRTTVEWARIQQVSHVFFRSLYRALVAAGGQPSVSSIHKAAVALCEDTAHQESQIWQDLLKPSPLLDSLHWQQSDIKMLLDEHSLTKAGADALDEYFVAAPGWHDLFAEGCVRVVRKQLGLAESTNLARAF
jgi:hypothetical protein